MKTINVNFDDILFQETGIRANSVTMRSAELTIHDAAYSLRCIKQNSEGRETLLVGLYDAADNPVRDIQIHCAGLSYASTDEHPDTAAIALTPGAQQSHFTLISAMLDLNVEIAIQLEAPAYEPEAKTENASELVMKLIGSVQQNISKYPQSATSDCPSEELVLAYAFHELDPTDTRKVGAHVHECLNCLDVVLAARYAEATAGELADMPLPEWLPSVASPAISDPAASPKGKNIFWRYPSVNDLIHDIGKRWNKMLEWPVAAMQSLSIENALLAASFRLESLTMHAADHDGYIVTAKWIVLENGEITDIQPVEVRIHDQQITGNHLDISGKLPSDLPYDDITLKFGWITTDGVIPLEHEKGMLRNGEFSRRLISKHDLNPAGKLTMLIVRFLRCLKTAV